MTCLQDGAYDATLYAAHHGLSRLGKPLVEFIWQIDGSGRTIKSFLHLVTRTGEPNAKGIDMTRRWATDWDGTDPDWFQKNIETCRAYPIRLSIVNEPSLSDPTRVFSQVKWVNRRDHWQVKAKADALANQTTRIAVREIDPAKVVELPEGIAMSMKGVWSAFAFLTSEWTGPERDSKWLGLVAEVGGDKLQIDFTEEDWRKVFEKISSPRKENEK